MNLTAPVRIVGVDKDMLVIPEEGKHLAYFHLSSLNGPDYWLEMNELENNFREIRKRPRYSRSSN